METMFVPTISSKLSGYQMPHLVACYLPFGKTCVPSKYDCLTRNCDKVMNKCSCNSFSQYPLTNILKSVSIQKIPVTFVRQLDIHSEATVSFMITAILELATRIQCFNGISLSFVSKPSIRDVTKVSFVLMEMTFIMLKTSRIILQNVW